MVPLRIWVAVMLGGVALAGGVAGIAANVRLSLEKHGPVVTAKEVAVQSIQAAAQRTDIMLAREPEQVWKRDMGDGHLAIKFLVTVDGGVRQYYTVTLLRSPWQVLDVVPAQP